MRAPRPVPQVRRGGPAVRVAEEPRGQKPDRAALLPAERAEFDADEPDESGPAVIVIGAGLEPDGHIMLCVVLNRTVRRPEQHLVGNHALGPGLRQSADFELLGPVERRASLRGGEHREDQPVDTFSKIGDGRIICAAITALAGAFDTRSDKTGGCVVFILPARDGAVRGGSDAAEQIGTAAGVGAGAGVLPAFGVGCEDHEGIHLPGFAAAARPA